MFRFTARTSAFGFHPVKLCQIAIDHYFLAADQQNRLLDPLLMPLS